MLLDEDKIKKVKEILEEARAMVKANVSSPLKLSLAYLRIKYAYILLTPNSAYEPDGNFTLGTSYM